MQAVKHFKKKVGTIKTTTDIIEKYFKWISKGAEVNIQRIKD